MNWSTPEMAHVAGVVKAITGLTFPEARRSFSEAGIRRIMRLHAYADLGEFARELETDPALRNRLIDELVVGETYFFRDPDQFTYLRSTALPEIAAELAPGAVVRVWCAGCASGEEAYSLAMLAHLLGLAARTSIRATDISEAAIARARRGTYTRWSFRASSWPWRERWFTYADQRWTARPELRSLVTFESENLLDFARRPVESVQDLIICRNVLMYLEPRAASEIMTAFAQALVPGGWLITSPSDPTPPQGIGLEANIAPMGIVYRRAGVQPQIPVVTGWIANGEPLAATAALYETTRSQAGAEMDPRLHVTLAMLLLDVHLPQAAIAAARRAIFLDRTLAVAHFVLGRALRQCGKLVPARRALHRAQELLARQPIEGVVAGTEAMTVGALVQNTVAELSLL